MNDKSRSRTLAMAARQPHSGPRPKGLLGRLSPAAVARLRQYNLPEADGEPSFTKAKKKSGRRQVGVRS